MAKKKESEKIYVVGWMPKKSKLPHELRWTYEKVFEDYDTAGMYLDVERNIHSDRFYKIEEF